MINELDDMKKIILLSMAAAMSFASCQKSEELTTDVGGSSEVVFTSAISTRATGTQWDDGDAIGVFMYETDNTYLYGENVLYTTSGGQSGTFTSKSPLVYPEGASVDFITYHPYTTTYSDYAVTLNTADQSSEANVKAQDFMVASAQSCNESSAPSLSFTRKMSKISIAVARKESVEDAELSNILLTNVITDGTFSVVNSNTKIENSSVKAGTTTNNISLFFNETSSLIEAIIVPQEGMSATLKIFIDGEEFATTIAGTFAENKQYSYNLSIGVNSIELSGATISDWGVTESGNLFVESIYTASASEIDADSVPTANIWTITDSGEITHDLMEGVRAALLVAEAEGRSISISMPNATEIGDEAFVVLAYDDEGGFTTSGCPALTAIELPNVTTIGDFAFACSGLTSFNFEGVTEIGEYAFGSCRNLSEVTNFSLTSIPDYAFNDCGLTSFDFAGVTEVGVQAFAGNTSLTEVTNFKISTIPYGLFATCPLTSFDFTWVTKIGERAFVGCSYLTEIELPSTVTSIGEYAFFSCSGLTTVTLNWTGNEILAYDSSWFMDTNKLTTIYIPSGTKADYVTMGWSSDLLVEKEQ